MVKSFLKTGIPRAARRFQMRQTTQEMLFVGQHRQRRRAALLVGARWKPDRIRGQDALARRRLLDLGDNCRRPALAESAGQKIPALCEIDRSARASTPGSRTARSSFFCSTIVARMSGSAFTMGGKLQL
jgi:hypothetical protein